MSSSYPVEIDAGQVVRWTVAECKIAPATLQTSASFATEIRKIPKQSKYRLSDEDLEDMSEAETVATLEIAPARREDGWRLFVVVEDEMGPRSSQEEQIDLEGFYDRFIRTGRGVASVTAEADDSDAEVRIAGLLAAIETNQHPVQI